MENPLSVNPGQIWWGIKIDGEYIIVPMSKEPGHDWLCARFQVCEHGEGSLLGAQIIPYSDDEIMKYFDYQGDIWHEVVE